MSQQIKESVTGDDVIELEEFAKAKRPVPPFTPGTQYRIRIDKVKKVVSVPQMTGTQILALVDKTAAGYRLDMKIHGGAPQKIEPDQVVDFTQPGIEKFMTLPLDQTDGALASTGHRSGR